MKLTIEEITKMILEAMETYQNEVGGISHDTMSSGIQSMKEDDKPTKKKKRLKKPLKKE